MKTAPLVTQHSKYHHFDILDSKFGPMVLVVFYTPERLETHPNQFLDPKKP